MQKVCVQFYHLRIVNIKHSQTQFSEYPQNKYVDGVKTYLWPHPQAVHHQREAEGFPLVYVPHVLAHAHVLAHVQCDVDLVLALALALALVLAEADKARKRCLGMRRTLEVQSGALGRS